MSRYTLTVLVSLLAAVPSIASATVRINEIAWMGSSANANAEWIELFNEGADSVSLTGWTLTALSGSPSVTLNGTIEANGFFLLERTSDESVPQIPKDQLYTGALSNSGATLVLKDADGATVDTVEGGSNWVDIGGDNATKHTAQRVTGSSWVTANGTPRATNAEQEVEEEEEIPEEEDPEAEETAPIVTISGYSTTSTPSSILSNKLYIVLGSNRIVSQGADTRYIATVYDKSGKPQKSANVEWAFGDGSKATGLSVRHAYYEPGSYVATARATHEGMSTVKILNVTVLPADVSITYVSERGIVLTNHTSELQDVSSWVLKSGKKRFVLPEGTVLGPDASVTFSPKVTRLPVSKEVSILYPNGDLLVIYEEEVQPLAKVESIPIVQEPLPELTFTPTPYANAVMVPAPEATLQGVGTSFASTTITIQPKPYTFFSSLISSFVDFVVP